MLTDLRTAFGLLTRLPVGSGPTPPDLARCVWAFPVVGLFVNGIAALVYAAGLPPLLGAAWALAATMALTGALHEDGLADTADGFGGGRTRTRKLEIMRDSRIGSYGALALMMSLLIRISAIATIHPLALIPAGMLGRGGMILVLLFLPPARQDGLGAAVRRPTVANAAAGLALAAIVTLLILPFRTAGMAMLLATVTAVALMRLARSQVGGHTGDILGATEVVIECVVFTVVAFAVGP